MVYRKNVVKKDDAKVAKEKVVYTGKKFHNIPIDVGNIPDGLCMVSRCSDPRFAAATTDFVKNCLEETSLHKVQIPGGLALLFGILLNGNKIIKWTVEPTFKMAVKKIIKELNIKSIILVAHEFCLAYDFLPKRSTLNIEDKQILDLRNFAYFLKSIDPTIKIGLYYANVVKIEGEDRIQFKEV